MLSIFKNSGTFQSDKLHIRARSIGPFGFKFYSIHQSDTYDMYPYTCVCIDLTAALNNYLNHIENEARKDNTKILDFYFQGKLVLTVSPT